MVARARNHVSVAKGEVLKGKVPAGKKAGRLDPNADITPSHSSRNDGGPSIKQHPHQHPLHHVDADHREMSMPEKYNQTGPGIKMGGHQHDLHHPHTDVGEVHHSAQRKGAY